LDGAGDGLGLLMSGVGEGVGRWVAHFDGFDAIWFGPDGELAAGEFESRGGGSGGGGRGSGLGDWGGGGIWGWEPEGEAAVGGDGDGRGGGGRGWGGRCGLGPCGRIEPEGEAVAGEFEARARPFIGVEPEREAVGGEFEFWDGPCGRIEPEGEAVAGEDETRGWPCGWSDAEGLRR
jgi:hypothetical protein